jgi:hypothetical protein
MNDVGVRIPLRGRREQGTVVIGYSLVSAADEAWALQYTWYLNRYGYAMRSLPRPASNSYLHREILGLGIGDPRIGDHINRDPLDNRRSNLRILLRHQHNHNMGGHRDSRDSKHRGVCYRPDRGKWRAYGSLARQWHHLGYFDTEEEAAEASRAWRLANMEAAVD